jgi:energy-coupling factor transport system ATP-binding protein
VIIPAGGAAAPDTPRSVLAEYAGAPSVTRLGRVLGWDPLPLTVREARAAASGHPLLGEAETEDPPPVRGDDLVRATAVSVDLGSTPAVRNVTFEVREGDVIALIGRNGAGKTTLLRALARLVDTNRGSVEGDATVAYVPQDPGSLLFAPTVRREVAETLRLLGRRDGGEVDVWLDRLAIDHLADRHPRSLAGGERQRIAIAAVAVGGAHVLLLDEPTRGMDASSRAALEQAVRTHAQSGGAVVLATHDIELAAQCATRAVVLGDGEVIAEGPARSVLAGSLYAPQVLRVLPPFLTVAEIERALEREPS